MANECDKKRNTVIGKAAFWLLVVVLFWSDTEIWQASDERETEEAYSDKGLICTHSDCLDKIDRDGLF